ncbi:MAG: hypothetical protein KDK07_15250 [Bauldia sp.]|nr:hypothetical protein [Bauldia sp.]
MSHPYPDQDLAEKVSALVQRGDIDRGDPAYGVALAAIDLGYDRLTRAQRGLFDRVVGPALAALARGEPPARMPSPPPRAAAVAANGTVAHAESANPWRPIREVPEGHDVQLAMLVDGSLSPLAFACRRDDRGWVNADTGKSVYVSPSHWRHWPGS